MFLLPDSIKTRAILVLLIGLTLSHIGSTLVYSTDHADELSSPSEQALFAKLSATLNLLDKAPAALRGDVATVASTPFLKVSWNDGNALAARPDDTAMLAKILAALGPTPPGPIHVVPEDGTLLTTAHFAHGAPVGRLVHVSAGLSDGSWANFHIHDPEPASLWSSRTMLSTLVMIAATLIIAVWATRWITSPLASFALAAERLGLDVTAPPLAENGPREVRAVARAFNQMQERIRSFVGDRLQMLAAISHDLRTPITRLRLRTEQLPIDPAQRDKMLGDLDEMEAMVAANLSFAKDEASSETTQAIDLAALLAAICDEAQDVGQNAEFDWTGRVIYQGRPLALKRLFSNLVENAIRYGGSARVGAAVRKHDIAITIEDDGPGIADEHLEAVFKPFHRLERSRNQRTGGIGLGLANARTIARAHGGDVVLTNRAEGGLIATVTLPR